MERTTKTLVCSGLLALAVTLSATGARAAELEVLHADSLAGPMRELKSAFEAKHRRRHAQSHVGRLARSRGADREGRHLRRVRALVARGHRPGPDGQEGRRHRPRRRDVVRRVLGQRDGDHHGEGQSARHPAGRATSRGRRSSSRASPARRTSPPAARSSSSSARPRRKASRSSRRRSSTRAGRSGEADAVPEHVERGEGRHAPTRASSTTRRRWLRATTSTSCALPTAST